MKKRQSKRRLDPEIRAWVKDRKDWRRKTHERPVTYHFPRLNDRKRINANAFAEAGYSWAPFKPTGNWQDCHRWCSEQFGRTYCWTGYHFWFQTDADRDKFKERWS